jgi:uncharacterized protein
MNPASIIATELNAQPRQIEAAISLIDEGSTVPFIARYRKEVTGGLDDAQLRHLDTRLSYLRELEDRRGKIIDSIQEQGKLTDELRQTLLNAESKTDLEDLYLPYKPKRRTKAQIAREAGLQPLADLLREQHDASPEQAAKPFVNEKSGIASTDDALEGARQIVMEEVAEIPELGKALREQFWNQAHMFSTVVKGKETEGEKFADYFEYSEPLHKIPSHRILALLRGYREGILKLSIELPDLDPADIHPSVAKIAGHLEVRPGAEWLMNALKSCWRIKLHTRIETELKTRVRETAEASAIDVFAKNLRSLLLAAPAGAKVTIGLDPGFRTGVKVAVTDGTGKLVDTATIYPHEPQKQRDASIATVAALAKKHSADLIAIGNGTASRETDRLAAELITKHPELGLQKLIVSEAGASVYSASETASKELPGVDVSLRGAASIARRLQDPLAELVKVEPKAIGVGQYQHDVDQTQLANSLNDVVEDCVNAVGVDLNSASAELLAHVSGLSATLAGNIVKYRDEAGRFKSRSELKKVARLGPKAFEQSAGFLRIMDGSNALDASSVHPEAYPVVKKIASDTGRDIRKLIGDTATLNALDPSRYTTEQFGLPTVKDIISELDKPGRDPRPEFKTAAFKDGIEKISDLKPDMVLEGVVSNVTHFGAFVDIGVHQDGLVHISALADKFVKDPHEVVSAGDVVKVRVVEIDEKRKRIALTMKLQDSAATNGARNGDSGRTSSSGKGQDGRSGNPGGNPGHASKTSGGKAHRSDSAGKRKSARSHTESSGRQGSRRESSMGSLGAALLDARNQAKKSKK